MEEKYTVKQVVESTRDILVAIAVPISLYESISEPIYRAVHNLNAIIEALGNDEMERQAKEKEDVS